MGKTLDDLYRMLDGLNTAFRLSFPCDINNYIDEYASITQTATPVSTKVSGANTINTYEIQKIIMPQMRYGVVKRLGYGINIGNITDMNFTVTVNEVNYPINIGAGRPSIVSLDIDDLSDIHILIKSGVILKVILTFTYPTATPALLNFNVWARFTGWYYGADK